MSTITFDSLLALIISKSVLIMDYEYKFELIDKEAVRYDRDVVHVGGDLSFHRHDNKNVFTIGNLLHLVDHKGINQSIKLIDVVTISDVSSVGRMRNANWDQIHDWMEDKNVAEEDGFKSKVRVSDHEFLIGGLAYDRDSDKDCVFHCDFKNRLIIKDSITNATYKLHIS
jgi:hypothetical protein